MVSIAYLNQAVESLHSFRSYSLRRQLLDAEKLDIMRYVENIPALQNLGVSVDHVSPLVGRVEEIATADIDRIFNVYVKARLFVLIPEALELDRQDQCIDLFVPLIDGMHDPEGIRYLFAVFAIFEKSELKSICSLATPMVSSISDPMLRGQILFSLAKITSDSREDIARHVIAFSDGAIDFSGYCSLIDVFAQLPKDLREIVSKICFPSCFLLNSVDAKAAHIKRFIKNFSIQEISSFLPLCNDYISMISDCHIDRRQSFQLQAEIIEFICETNSIDRDLLCLFVKHFCESRGVDDWKNLLPLFRSILSIPEFYRAYFYDKNQSLVSRFSSLYHLGAYVDVVSKASESDMEELLFLSNKYCELFPSEDNGEHSLSRFLQSTFLIAKSNRIKAFHYMASLKQQVAGIDDETKLFSTLGEMQEEDLNQVSSLTVKYFARFTKIHMIIKALSHISREEREYFAMQASSLLSSLPPDEKTCVFLVLMSYFRPTLSVHVLEKILSHNLIHFDDSIRFISEYAKRLVDLSPELKDEFNAYFNTQWTLTTMSNAQRRSLALEIIDLCRYLHFSADNPLVLAAIDHVVFNDQRIRFSPFITVFMQNRLLIPPMQNALIRWMQSGADEQCVKKLSLEILDHARFLYNANAKALLKESINQVLVLDGYSFHKLIPVFSKAPNSLPVFHELLISLFRQITDRHTVRFLARQTLSNPLHLAIDQDHDVFQEALRVMILSDQLSDKKNPYILYAYLQSMIDQHIRIISQPSIPYKNSLVTVNFPGLKEQAKKCIALDEMLTITKGQRFAPQTLASLSCHLLERIDALAPLERDALHRFVHEISSADCRFLCENLQDPLFKQILSTPIHDHVPMVQAYLNAYLAFILNLSNERCERDTLSLQEQALLQMSASIQNCPTGKTEGIILAYQLLPENFRYKVYDHQSDLPIAQKAKAFVREVISSFMLQQCSADNAMMKKMTGVSTVINQLAHQSLYVKNLLFSHVGMDHELQFDSNSGVLYDELIAKDIDHVFQIFSQHMHPSMIINEIKNQFERTDEIKKANLFNGFSEIVSGILPPSQMWNISDHDGSYQLTDVGALELLLSCKFFHITP